MRKVSKAMGKASTFHTTMEARGKMLSEDPETKDRYGKATKDGKEWFRFSQWVSESKSRWHNSEADRKSVV